MKFANIDGDIPPHYHHNVKSGAQEGSLLRAIQKFAITKKQALNARHPKQCTYMGTQTGKAFQRGFHPYASELYPGALITTHRPQLSFTSFGNQVEIDTIF